MTDDLNKIAIFQKKEIRKVLHNGEWWFVINDIIAELTDSIDPSGYLRDMRRRDEEVAKLFEPVEKGEGQFAHPLLLVFNTTGGKQKLLSWNTEGIFRIIQSIPSPKAEPFKRWLARVGYERVQEIENPELAQKRMKAIYRAKGYDDKWIERRVRGIATRNELTDEWDNREVEGRQNYAILTAEISKATFDITPSEYKKMKGLKRQNLRDHMDTMELLFAELGEASTIAIARVDNSIGMDENRDAAKRGGAVAGTARKQLENETGEKVVNKNNHLPKSNITKLN